MNDIEITLTPGNDTEVIEWMAPTATTNCFDGGILVTQIEGLSSGTAFEAGNYFIEYEATDNCSSSVKCGFNIIIHAAPTGEISMLCNDDIKVTIAPGMSGKVVTWTAPTASSTCPLPGLEVTQVSGPHSGEMLSAGTYQVVYVATDACLDEEVVCEFTIVVLPPPTSEVELNCNSNIEVMLTPGATGQVATWETPTASTTCPLGGLGVVQVQGPTSGSELSPGIYTVVYQAYDACLSTEMCSFNIIVKDAPTGEIEFNCNDDIVTFVVPGTNSQTVIWAAPTATTTCPIGGVTVEQTYGPASGSLLTAGVYTVIYLATDACGNSKTCEFTIKVDNVVPCAMRDIKEVVDCNFENPFNFFLSGMVEGVAGISDFYTYQSGSFTEYENGTASLEMTVRNKGNASAQLKMSLVYTGRTTSALPAPIPPQCFSTDFPDWYYYENVTGLIEGQGVLQGAKLFATWKMNKPQIGTGANLFTDELGMVTWLDLTVVTQPKDNDIHLSVQDYVADIHLALTGETTDCSNDTEVVITCPTALRVAAAPGAVNATMAWSSPLAVTTCTDPAVFIEQMSGPTSGESLPIGTFEMVKYRATDQCGNEAFCTFSVAITAVPSAVCANHEVFDGAVACDDTTEQFLIAPGLAPDDDRFVIVSKGNLTELINQTAKLVVGIENVTDPSIKYMMSINFGGKTNEVPSGVDYEADCYQLDVADLAYFNDISGYLIGEGNMAGAKLAIVSTGKPFTIGNGAGLTDSDLFGGFMNAKLELVTQSLTLEHELPDSIDIALRMHLSGAIGDCSDTKPVFDLAATNSFGNTFLTWTNNTGVNNAYFAVERSIIGGKFKQIAKVESFSISGELTYTYLDEKTPEGTSLYRIRAIQKDGLVLTSNEASIFMIGEKEAIQVGPVPTNDKVSVDLSSLTGEFGTVSLMNEVGLAVWNSGQMEFAKEPLELSCGQYKAGVYQLLIIVNTDYKVKVITKTIVISKM